MSLRSVSFPSHCAVNGIFILCFIYTHMQKQFFVISFLCIPKLQHHEQTMTSHKNRKYSRHMKPHLVLFHNQILTDRNIPRLLLEVTMFTHGWRPW